MTAAVIWSAQGQRRASLSRRRRALRARRPATENTRSRSRLGSQRRAVPGEGEHLGPSRELAGQGDDLARAGTGRSSSGAGCGVRCSSRRGSGPRSRPRRRCRSSRPASWPFASVVKAVKAVNRCASMSVNRSCAPGCGRSLRTMTRIPAGQDDRSSIPVMSATQARLGPARRRHRRASRNRRGPGGDRVLHVLGDGHADRVVQAAGIRGQPLQEPVRAATGVGPDEHLAPQQAGQLGQRQPGGLDMVGGHIAGACRSAAPWSAAPGPCRRHGRRRRSWDENRTSSSRSAPQVARSR